MGQQRRVIQRIYQPPVKNSQSAFRQNPRDALQTQGSGLAMSKLWDGSEKNTRIIKLRKMTIGITLHMEKQNVVMKLGAREISYKRKWMVGEIIWKTDVMKLFLLEKSIIPVNLPLRKER
jgi:hypothetical protein